MTSTSSRDRGPGPFSSFQIRPRDPYELHDGHPVLCSPQGGQGAFSTALGALIILSDPAVKSAGIDPGFSPEKSILRAPGWIEGVPDLAVEYADTGQDETQLQAKIRTFLDKGTKCIWVVRLVGMPRVEVPEPGKGVRTLDLDASLEAPGILANPISIRALFEKDRAFETALRNLIQRKGYRDWDDLIGRTREQGREEGLQRGRAEGRAEGRQEASTRIALRLFQARFGEPATTLKDRLGSLSPAQLETLAEILLISNSRRDVDEWLQEQ